MEKSQLIEILSDWNPWNQEIKTGFVREKYLEKLERLHKTGQVVTVTGVRRAGKSTILKQYMEKLAKKHGTDKILYVNFEEPFFANPDLELLLKIFDAYKEIINPAGHAFVFLDEVQKVAGWEKFVRGLHEKGTADVFVSGSTSSLISQDYGTLLTGRHIDMAVFPFSFQEFLFVQGVKDKKTALLEKYKTANRLREYLAWGGFPKAVLVPEEKKTILNAYFEDILGKDIIEKYKVRETEKLRELARYYLSNISSPHSFNKIGAFLKLSVDTVDRFSSFFADVYLFFFIKRFSFSLKEQNVNPRKVYCIDTGLREAAAFKFSKDIGKVIENTVAINLLRNGKQVYYWKQKKSDFEIDFVVKEDNEITEAIQVSYENNPRQERAIKTIEKELNPKKITLIGWDAPKTPYNGTSLSKWLLEI